jgi:hypothetical protein
MQGNELTLTIITVILVTAFFSFRAYRQKKASWEGTLVKKRRYEDDESGQITYTLIYKAEGGKKHRVKIKSKAEFDSWQEGDKAIKKSGEYFPQKA